MDACGLPSNCTDSQSNNSRILLIDDDPTLLGSLAAMLTMRLDRVLVEVCGNPAFAEDMARRGQYDLILCDVSMPHIDGLTLLPWLRHSAPDAIIVMMSGTGDQEVREKAFIYGATAFLDKPFDRERLTLMLKQLLQNTTKRRSSQDVSSRPSICMPI